MMLAAPATASNSFEIGSPMHLLVVGGCAFATAVAVLLGRRLKRRRPPREQTLRIAWGCSIALTQVVAIIWYLLPSNFSWRISLPLHICDIVAVLAAVAMVGSVRWVGSIVYFWGIGLCTVAFVWPSVEQGPGHLEFYLFWLTHLQIVGSAVYLAAVTEYVPRWRDWLIAEALLTLYCIIIIPVDAVFDLNYGYIGPVDSVARVMGPWPWRISAMYLVQMVVLASLLVPWAIASRRAGPGIRAAE